MTDFFVNLIASVDNMRFVYGMFVVWLLGGAILVGALNKPQWFSSWLISSIVLMFGVLHVDAELHRLLNDRKSEAGSVIREVDQSFVVVNHYKRSRNDINDEFGEWELFDVSLSDAYKNYIIMEFAN